MYIYIDREIDIYIYFFGGAKLHLSSSNHQFMHGTNFDTIRPASCFYSYVLTEHEKCVGL